MKKMIKVAFVAVVAIVSAYNFTQNLNSTSVMNLTLGDIESIAACESVGWWDNDGNCVKNDAGVYFCKSDSWDSITDCLQ